MGKSSPTSVLRGPLRKRVRQKGPDASCCTIIPQNVAPSTSQATVAGQDEASQQAAVLNTVTQGLDNLVAAGSAVPYPGYFERQSLARCGMHALNNALGGPFHTAADMDLACTMYLRAACREGLIEVRSQHQTSTGWYSSEVMACACRADAAWACRARSALAASLRQPWHAVHQCGRGGQHLR